MAFDYPVFLDLRAVPVLVVGGGAVALRKAAGLAAAGASVTVVAPTVHPDLVVLATEVRRREFVDADVEGQRLVLTATDRPAVNAAVAAAATRAGVWVNSADDPANCTFILPAVARRGPVIAAVSSGGASPALAQALRDEIAAASLGPGVDGAAADLAGQRDDVKRSGRSTEDIDWSERVRVALARARASS